MALQVLGQLMPAALLLTVPVPVPANVTESAKVVTRYSPPYVLDDEVLQIPTGSAEGSASWRLEREGIMRSTSPDPPRWRLDPESYEALRQQVLRRDGWRCQSCGMMSMTCSRQVSHPVAAIINEEEPDWSGT